MNLASISYYYNSKTEVAGRAKTDTELCDRIERIQGRISRLWLSPAGQAASS
jgi:hypothetical protein